MDCCARNLLIASTPRRHYKKSRRTDKLNKDGNTDHTAANPLHSNPRLPQNPPPQMPFLARETVIVLIARIPELEILLSTRANKGDCARYYISCRAIFHVRGIGGCLKGPDWGKVWEMSRKGVAVPQKQIQAVKLNYSVSSRIETRWKEAGTYIVERKLGSCANRPISKLPPTPPPSIHSAHSY